MRLVGPLPSWSSWAGKAPSGTFGITEEGNWVYDLDNNDPDTQGLIDTREANATDRFTIAQSGAGGATADVVITITGASDPELLRGSCSGR